MTIQIELLKYITIPIVHEAHILMVTETVVLFYRFVLLVQLREQWRWLAAVFAGNKAILRNDSFIIYFYFATRLHLHAIVSLVEIHIITKLDTKTKVLHCIRINNPFMVEHKVFFNDELFFGSFLIRIIKCSICFEHRTTSTCKFQILMLIDAPRRITTFWTSSKWEFWSALFCYTITLWAISHRYQVVFPIECRDATNFKLELLSAELIAWSQFLYTLRGWTCQFYHFWFCNIILAIFLFLWRIHTCLQLDTSFRKGIVRQKSTVSHEFYETFTLDVGILSLASLYQILERSFSRIIRLQSVFLFFIVIEFLDKSK